MDITAMLVAPDQGFAERFVGALEKHVVEVIKTHYSRTMDAALYLASHYLPEVLFVDEEYGEHELKRFIGEMRVENPASVHIMLTESEGREALGKALRIGARDYLVKDALEPVEFDRCLWGLLPGRRREVADDDGLGAFLWSRDSNAGLTLEFGRKHRR